MQGEGIGVANLFAIGPLEFSVSLLTCLGLTLFLGLLFYLLSHKLQRTPGSVQVMLEGIVTTLEGAVEQVAGRHTARIMPFIASLWVFLVCANLLGLIPGLDTPTRDLKSYLRHYLSPSPIMLPFHIISEITRTVALAVRLFGNMMSLEMAALLILMVAGFLVPVPILMLHVVEALVQAYIFGMLALIYVAGGIQSQEERQVTQGVTDE
jgi:F-type H+-transporting ATPase subunit a